MIKKGDTVRTPDGKIGIVTGFASTRFGRLVFLDGNILIAYALGSLTVIKEFDR